MKTYDKLKWYIETFQTGKMALLIIIGSPGLGKTQTVQRMLGEEICLIEGGVSAYLLYRLLYQHQNKLVVIDDVDGLHKDRECVALLKCLCQSVPEKRVTWNKRLTKLDREELEPEFVTTSRVIIISNDWKSINKNVASLEDRGHVISFEPSIQEIHDYVGTWFKDQSVYEWFGENLHRIERLSFRDYLRASELREAGLLWTDMLDPVKKVEKMELVAELMKSNAYSDMKSRLEVFQKKGCGSSSSFWAYVKRYRDEQGH